MRCGRTHSSVYDVWTGAPSLLPGGPDRVGETAVPDPQLSVPSRQQPGDRPDHRAAGNGPPPARPEVGEPKAGRTAPSRGVRGRRPPRWRGVHRAANSCGNGGQTIPTYGQSPSSVRTWQNTHTSVDVRDVRRSTVDVPSSEPSNSVIDRVRQGHGALVVQPKSDRSQQLMGEELTSTRCIAECGGLTDDERAQGGRKPVGAACQRTTERWRCARSSARSTG